MIKDTFYIEDFEVEILYEVTCDDIDIIIETLEGINCPKYFLKEAMNNLESCDLNIGLTYSNLSLKKSIIVVSKASSFGQLLNTLTHECYHLVCHISKVFKNYNEERLANLMGTLTMQSYNIIKNL